MVIKQIIFIFLLIIIGCAPNKLCLYSAHQKLYFPPQTVVDTQKLQAISWEDFIKKLETVQVVYVGEKHTSKADHALQLKIAQALIEKKKNLAIGLEMVMRSRQKVLDEWINGKLTQKELLKKLDWEEVWGHDFSLYRDIFLWAKKHHIPLIALNAPPGLVKKIAMYGISSLLPKERAYLAQKVDLNNPEHRAFIEQEYKRHKHLNKHGISKFEYFYQAQCIWDETMAETIAQYLKAHSQKQLLVFAGKGHISYKFGVPQRVIKRLPVSYVTVLPLPTDEKVMPDIADFIYVTK